MFDSFRDKIRSVVQDGIHLNKTVRQKITQAHQHSARASKNINDNFDGSVNLKAGSTILEKYQNEWKEIHEMAENCSKEAETVDFYMTSVHLGIAKRLEDISQINSTLSSLPKVISDVDSCITRLKSLHDKFNEVENDLTNLELKIDRCDFEQRKLEHTFQLSMYKEKKLVELEKYRLNLVSKQTEILKEADKHQRDVLKERQLAASLAFQEDLTFYKTQGELPRKISLAKDSTSDVTLEEIELTTEDNAELDKFLSEEL